MSYNTEWLFRLTRKLLRRTQLSRVFLRRQRNERDNTGNTTCIANNHPTAEHREIDRLTI